MSFLFPSFLWALAAIAIPIAIHLFNFRRTKKVYFTNVAFLRAVETQTSSFRRLKQLLTLLARVLFLACLVFAFAQPFIPTANKLGLDRKGVTSFYVDNSYSMQNEENTQRYLDVAKNKLDELLTIFKNATNIQLITNDFNSQEQAVSSSTQIKDRLTTVDLSHTPRSFEAIYKRQVNLLGRHSSGKNQLFWFSDFQKSTAGNLKNIKIDTTNRLFIVPVQAKARQNIFVDSVWLNTPFIRELQNNILYVKVSNSGEDKVTNLVVKLFIDNVQVSTAPVNVAARGSSTASFNFNVKGKGFKRGRITFDDYPITFDNTHFFVLNASPTIKILHLTGSQITNKYVENVFGNDSLFLTRSLNINNADVGLFKTADLIVIEGLERVEGSARAEIERFVKNGGSLAVIPPPAPDLTSYGQFLGNLGVTDLTPRSSTNPAPTPLAIPDRRNPFFSDVFEESIRETASLDVPSASPVWQWRAGSSLLNLRNGNLFLSQNNSQRGKVYVFATPLAADFGNFGQHALFVPTFYKIAAMSVRQQRTAYSFEENNIVLTLDNPNKNDIYKLKPAADTGGTAKNGGDIIPVQRLIGNQLFIEMPKSNQLGANQAVESGYYDLTLNGKTQQLLAFNHDNRESMMDYFTSSDLREFFKNQPNVQVFDKIADADFVKEFEKQNFGKTLWKYFLCAALFFLLAEIIIIRFIK